MSWITNLDERHVPQPDAVHREEPLREAILRTLHLRFGYIPHASVRHVQQVSDSVQLWQLLYDAMTTPNLATFGHLPDEQG